MRRLRAVEPVRRRVATAADAPTASVERLRLRLLHRLLVELVWLRTAVRLRLRLRVVLRHAATHRRPWCGVPEPERRRWMVRCRTLALLRPERRVGVVERNCDEQDTFRGNERESSTRT